MGFFTKLAEAFKASWTTRTKSEDCQDDGGIIPFSFPETRLLIITDTHGLLKNFSVYTYSTEAADAIFSLGDLYCSDAKKLKAMAEKYKKPLYAIPGNHEPEGMYEALGIDVFHGEVREVNGIRFAGWGGCPRYKEESCLCMMTEKEGIKFGKNLPEADILLSHSPFKRKNIDNFARSGFQGITDYLERYNVPLHFYGHLHEMRTDILSNGTQSYCLYMGAVVKLGSEVKIIPLKKS